MGTQAEFDAQELYDVLDLGPLRGRPPVEFDIEVVRSLEDEDIPTILEPPAEVTQFNKLSVIKFKHHQIARLVAEGKSPVDISSVTGYSPYYIGKLSNDDPMFKELVWHYLNVGEIAREDVLVRMNSLNLAAMEELQKRIDESPEDWSKRELMDLSEQMSKPIVAKMAAPQGAFAARSAEGGVNISVNFVAPQDAKPAVEIDAVDVKSEDVAN